MYDQEPVKLPPGSRVTASPPKERSTIQKLLDNFMDTAMMIPPNPHPDNNKPPVVKRKPKPAPGTFQGASPQKKIEYADEVTYGIIHGK